MPQAGSNSTEQPNSLPSNQRCCFAVVEGEVGRTEGHIGEGTLPVVGILVEGSLVADTLAEGTLVEDKHPLHTLPEDNLEEVGRRRGVVAGCSNSCC